MADNLAISVAHILAAANRRACELGWGVSQSPVTISQHFEDAWFWRINYGAKSPVNQRGGDLVVEINAGDAEVRRVLRGQ
jgi:hypothetical protein